MKKIGIVGFGVVGQGMMRLFEDKFSVTAYDPLQGETMRMGDRDLEIICVPTPQKEDGSCDISTVEECVMTSTAPLILIKSTIPPGTIDYLRRKYQKNINFSPEYMGESSYFTPYWKYPAPDMPETHTFVIVGGEEANEILPFFQEVMSVDTKYVACTAVEAELTKYAENTFFATKVTFCNEFAEIAEKFGADWLQIRELWLLDSRINPNHTIVHRNNPGFGGKCYPKDLSAIIEAARERGYEPTLLSAVKKSNEHRRSL